MDKVADSIPLFMVPGMNHCAGGDGADSFDRVTALEQILQKKLPAGLRAIVFEEGSLRHL